MKKDKKSILIFTIGFFSAFWVRILGVMSIGELIVLFFSVLLFLGNGKRYLQNTLFRKLIVFLFVFLLGVVLSNLYNNSSSDDFLKGFGTIFLILPNLFVAYWLLNDNLQRIKYFAVGTLLSMIITNFFLTYFSYEHILGYNINTADDLFAYRFAPLMLTIIALFHYHKQKFISILMLFMGVFFLLGGSRNLFLIYELSAVMLLFMGNTTDENREQKYMMLRKNGLKIVLSVAVGGIIAFYGYKELAINGYLGDLAAKKYEMQSSSKLGMLAGGRFDAVIGLYAVAKSPIFGYGSYAKDNEGINDEVSFIFGEDNYMEDNEQIRSHSYIIGFWVWNGILSLPFWIFVIAQLILYLRRNICSEPQIMAYLLVSVITLLWNIFFSPFADRINFSFVLISILIINSRYRDQIISNKLS